jgi:hypothetical protein
MRRDRGNGTPMLEQSRAEFLSYASQDAEATRRICTMESAVLRLPSLIGCTAQRA